MAGRIRRHGSSNGLDAWPGYVDALSTLLMVIIFVLLVFVLAQAFLTVALTGRSHQLDKANQELSELTSALALEKGHSDSLQVSVSRLGQELAARSSERDKLAAQVKDTLGQVRAGQVQLADAQAQLTEMKRQIAELDKTVATDKATLQAKLSDLATLANQVNALTALRDELELSLIHI